MKHHISKTILFTAIGALAAALPANSLLAQQTSASSVLIDGIRYVPITTAATVIAAPAGGSPLAPEQPKTRRTPNLFLEVGVGFGKEDFKLDEQEEEDNFISDMNNLIGGTLAFGWRINQKNKIQIEIGYFSASASNTYSVHDNVPVSPTNWAVSDLDMKIMPVLFSYSYCISLGQDGRCEIRLTPTVGLYNMKLELGDHGLDDNEYWVDPTVSKSATPFAYGASVGFTYHFSKNFYADAGYRFLHRGRMELVNNEEGSNGFKAANTHWLTASVGWKF